MVAGKGALTEGADEAGLCEAGGGRASHAGLQAAERARWGARGARGARGGRTGRAQRWAWRAWIEGARRVPPLTQQLGGGGRWSGLHRCTSRLA
jgi:hypothetical protein